MNLNILKKKKLIARIEYFVNEINCGGITTTTTSRKFFFFFC